MVYLGGSSSSHSLPIKPASQRSTDETEKKARDRRAATHLVTGMKACACPKPDGNGPIWRGKLDSEIATSPKSAKNANHPYALALLCVVESMLARFACAWLL